MAHSTSQSQLLPVPLATASQSSHVSGKVTPSPLSSRSTSTSSNNTLDIGDQQLVTKRKTLAFIRRVLVPPTANAPPDDKSIEDSLPPLTSSNDTDFELYAITAIIIQELVRSWYSKLTNDQVFVEEVIHILAHCTRALESRFRKLDLNILLLDEIPAVINTHFNYTRISLERSKLDQDAPSARSIFHSLSPHPALTPIPSPEDATVQGEQRSHESDYRHLLVQGALAILLPTEDLENSGLRVFLTDVIAEAILGNAVGGKVCEDWFIWTSITKLVGVIRADVNAKTSGEEIKTESRSRLEKFGLVSQHSTRESRQQKRQEPSRAASIFWTGLQMLYLAGLMVQMLIVGLYRAYVTRPRTSSQDSLKLLRPKKPLLSFQIFTMVANFLDLSIRMPWLAGFLALGQYHLTSGALQMLGARDRILDIYLRNLLQSHLTPSTLLPQFLRLTRVNLFPNNTLPSSATLAPPEEERRRLKRRAAEAILSLSPTSISFRYLLSNNESRSSSSPQQFSPKHASSGAGAHHSNSASASPVTSKFDAEPQAQVLTKHNLAVQAVEIEFLGVWDDAWINKHLAYRILELILVRVMPELSEMGPKELMDARLGEDWDNL